MYRQLASHQAQKGTSGRFLACLIQLRCPIGRCRHEVQVGDRVNEHQCCTGRVFFVCRRAAGNLPEGRCDFFQWEGDRQLRGSRAQGAAKSVTLKGCWN